MAMADKPDLSELMEMAQKMQKGMQNIQDELISREFSGKAADQVEVVLNGQYDCVRVNISDEAIAEDKEVLQDLLAAAFNGASKKVKSASKNAMLDVYKKTGAPLGETGDVDK